MALLIVVGRLLLWQNRISRTALRSFRARSTSSSCNPCSRSVAGHGISQVIRARSGELFSIETIGSKRKAGSIRSSSQ